MKRIRSSMGALAVFAGCALLAPAPAWAEDPALAQVELGTHWFGPKIAHEDLIGKVVLFVKWGS